MFLQTQEMSVSQVPRVEKGESGQGKDGWVGGCLYSLQAGLSQVMEGTHKSAEPVSKMTLNS